MACNECEDNNLIEEECAQDCGCSKHYDASCVRFNKKDLPCVGKPKGTDIEQIIEEIDTKLCSITDGSDGSSAYELAVGNGFNGTENEWLESLDGGEEIVRYREDELLEDTALTGAVGVWNDTSDLATIFPEPITGYSYTVPTGGTGNYEVTFQSSIDVTLGINGDSGAAAQIFVNGALRTSSTSVTTTLTGITFTSLSLFQTNISLSDGDVIDVRLAVVDKSNTGFRKSKLQIKKLP